MLFMGWSEDVNGQCLISPQVASDAKDPTEGELIEDRPWSGSEKTAIGDVDPEVRAETVLVGLECIQLGPEDGVSA
jgi:hypothetical protein